MVWVGGSLKDLCVQPPAHGGSHSPFLLVVAPVSILHFPEGKGELWGQGWPSAYLGQRFSPGCFFSLQELLKDFREEQIIPT